MQETFYKAYLLIVLSVGGVWLRSSIGKIIAGTFDTSLTPTLTKFASKNPYLWYKGFLEQVVIPQTKIYAPLIMWGELFVAGALVASSILLLLGIQNKGVVYLLTAGLIGAIILNASFWLASSWTSPASDSLNLLMVTIELIAVYYSLKILQ